MIQFEFTINKSFRKYSRRPVTIPKRFNNQLKVEQLAQPGHITIITPEDCQLKGRIYQGTNNRGLYYQIHISDAYSDDYLSNLQLGMSLIVKIFKNTDSGVVVSLKEK